MSMDGLNRYIINSMNHVSLSVALGIYRHYKGGEYRVTGVGKDTETEAEVVIYQPLYDSDVAYWVRPLAMFNDEVTVNGEPTRRFQKVDEND